jgi:hypothetical protein
MMIGLKRMVLTATAAMLVASGTAWGTPQTTEQQKCINKVNEAGNKLHEAQGADHRACVKDFGKAR